MAEAPTSPYVGPSPFGEEHAERFFGRDQETRLLAALVVARRIVLLYAPSGAGKTSLLQAGVIPRLRRESGIRVLPIVRVARDPGPEHGERDAGNVFLHNTLAQLPGARTETSDADPHALSDGLAACLRSEEGASRPSLLVLDQFEEFFTRYPERGEERSQFFLALRQALEAHRQLSLLISMQEEYLAHLDPHTVQVPDRLRTRFRLGPLGRAAALEAIRQPAIRAGVDFTRAAAERLVEDLSRPPGEERPADGLPRGEQFVEPVHLQVVCDRLWERRFQIGSQPGRPEAEAFTINEGDVIALGDVSSALADFYAERVAAVARETGVGERVIRDWCETVLISGSGVRRQVLREAEESEGLPNRAVEALVRAHVLRPVRDEGPGGRRWFELAHDRLVRAVRENNASWRQEHLSALQRQAAVWDAEGRRPEFLLQGSVLEEGWAWAVMHGSELADAEHLFLQDSLRAYEAAERERLHTRLIRQLGIAAMVAATLAIIGFFLYRAQYERALASDSRRLAEVAQRQLASDPVASVHLALRALADPPNRPYVPEAELALASAVQRSLERGYLQNGVAGADAVAFGPERIAVGGEALLLTSYDLTETSELTRTEELRTHVRWSEDGALLSYGLHSLEVWRDEALLGSRVMSEEIAWAARQPGGELIAVASGMTVSLWAAGSDRLETAVALSGTLREASWSPDGRWLAAWAWARRSDPWIAFWDARTGVSALQGGHTESVRALAWCPDSSCAVSASDDGTARIWSLDPVRPRAALLGHSAPVVGVAVLDPERVLTWSEDGIARLWRLGDGAPIQSYGAPHEGGPDQYHVRGVIPSPAKDRLLVLYDRTDGGPVLRLYDTASGEPAGDLAGLSVVVAAAWQGDRLATATVDGVICIWDVGGASLQPLAVLRGHTGRVYGLRWRDEHRLLSYAEDGTLRLWELFRYGEPWGRHGGSIRSARWLDDGSILTSGNDGNARRWSGAGAHGELTSERGWENTWSPDGVRVLSFMPNKCAPCGYARSYPEGTLLFALPMTISSAFWDEAGLVVSDRQGGVWLIDAESGAVRAPLVGHAKQVDDVAWHDTRLATAGRDGMVWQWDSRSGASLGEPLAADANCVRLVRWNNDGHRLVVGGCSGEVSVWDARRGERLWSRHVSESEGPEPVTWLALSPRGDRIAAAAGSTFRLWRVRDGEEDWAFAGHGGPVLGVQWAGSGRRLLTWSADGTARIWDVQLRKEVQRVESPQGRRVDLAALDREGSRILTASGDALWVWRAWPRRKELIAEARVCCLTRDLTEIQRLEFYGE